MWFWELHPGPLQEWQTLLTTAVFLALVANHWAASPALVMSSVFHLSIQNFLSPTQDSSFVTGAKINK